MGDGFPFFVDGEATITTDDLSREKHGTSWVLIVDKPPQMEVPDHTLCCYRHRRLCLVQTEIAASPGTPNTTAISPCANHPGVFLHHRCQTMAEEAMRKESGRTFDSLPLGSFCHACLLNCSN